MQYWTTHLKMLWYTSWDHDDVLWIETVTSEYIVLWWKRPRSACNREKRCISYGSQGHSIHSILKAMYFIDQLFSKLLMIVDAFLMCMLHQDSYNQQRNIETSLTKSRSPRNPVPIILEDDSMANAILGALSVHFQLTSTCMQLVRRPLSPWMPWQGLLSIC
jgi:hypothetical protein